MRSLRPHNARRRGVTLIEVVIAIFVLSVGILGIMSLFPTGYRLTKKSVDRSIAALAARHAEARIYARINKIKPPVAASEPLATVTEGRRVGVISAVAQNTLTCTILGGQSPSWTANALVEYYVVMTSGTADGHIYPIGGNGANTIDTKDTGTTRVRFNQGTETQYEPVRVGDTFAIIGIKSTSPTQCFPDPFLGGALTGTDPLGRPADPESNETRTMPVATYGAPGQAKDLWRYSYGCVLSVPFPERPDTCRLDIFIYSGFPYRAASGDATYPNPSAANSIVIGHYVAYVPAGRGT